MSICALILAAGKGTRMRQERPKVLQKLLDEPMLWYVWNCLGQVVDKSKIYTLIGHGAQEVEAVFSSYDMHFILQKEQLGTGHALQCAWKELLATSVDWCFVVNGDSPLILSESLHELFLATKEQGADIGFCSLELDDPAGYGRVIRDENGLVQSIVEDKDLAGLGLQGHQLPEVNAGLYCLNIPRVQDYLFQLDNRNEQQEFYLTQLISLAKSHSRKVVAVNAGQDLSLLGINSPLELASCEELLRTRIINCCLEKGVVVHSPDLIRIGPRVRISPGVELTGPVEIYGASTIKHGCAIASHVVIKDCQLDSNVKIDSFSHLQGAEIGSGAQVGPFARLRPGACLQDEVKVGNFVEVKKSLIEPGAKVSHLSYIGDAIVGERTNIGAGTITCNYDGKHKHQTKIGKAVFVGSNTALVAPVTIGDQSLVGAGSTITKDVPEKSLAVARSRQKVLTRRDKK